VEFYLDQLTTGRAQVAFYEEMLGLEERKGNMAVRRPGWHEAECAELEAEMRVLRLREDVDALRETVVGVDKQAKKAKKAVDESPVKYEEEDEWTVYGETEGDREQGVEGGNVCDRLTSTRTEGRRGPPSVGRAVG
jgi:hypothetical protein